MTNTEKEIQNLIREQKLTPRVAERVKKNLYDIFGDKEVFKESFDAWNVFETAPNANEAIQLFAYAFVKKPSETIDAIADILNKEDK